MECIRVPSSHLVVSFRPLRRHSCRIGDLIDRIVIPIERIGVPIDSVAVPIDRIINRIDGIADFIGSNADPIDRIGVAENSVMLEA
jgi:hypothetical protein